MTPEEFRYLKAAVEAIEQGCTPMAEAKILKTVSQICGKSATEIEQKLVDSLDDVLYNKHIH
jgi:bacterioferritin-associated ferredoxin